MINPMELSGKTVLITGASDGIGKATTLLLSQLGAKVIMIARNEEKLQSISEILGVQNHVWYSYDLRNIDGIEDLVKRIVADHGALDGFVHCAGVAFMRPLLMSNYLFIHDMMLVNFYCFIELVRCLSKKNFFNPNGMSIIAMSSIASVQGDKSKTAYCATKAALEGAIRAMAKELCNKKIRINSIRACFVKTEMFESYKEKTGKTEEDLRFGYCLGLGEPIDIANAIAYLLSDCSRIITGTSFVIDSGVTS